MCLGSVIIVSYNSAACIEACLRAVLGKSWKIILVDNASVDATVEIAKRVTPNICMLLNADNTGFAAAVNQGVKAAEGEALVILNPDSMAMPGSLDRLAHALSAEGVGAACGSLARIDGRPDKGFTFRRFPTLTGTAAELLLLNRLWPGNPWNRHYRCLDLDYSRVQEVEQPAGACLAIKRKAWDDVGGFDEGFFPVWFEDVDFCRRLHDRGWKILYCPNAVFVHVGGHSLNKLAFGERQRFWYRNLLRYFAKHHSRLELVLLRIGVFAGLALRSLLSLLGLGAPGVPMTEALSAYGHVAWRYVIMGRDFEPDRKSAVITSPAV